MNRVRQPVRHDIASVAAVMDYIDPNLPQREWMRALMGIYYETCGSEEGFNLASAWSSQRKNYCGTNKLKAYWRTLRADLPNPVRMGTLIWLAKHFPKD